MITTVLTDNGKEFTDRFCATGQRQPTGAHAFDRVCIANRIEHRLTKPRTPQTNGMIERFIGRITEVLATTRFDSAGRLADTIKRYVKVYNQHIPQKALGHIPPLQAMKNRSQKQPQLFKKCVYNVAGLDAAHIYSDVQTVGCRALFRLVGKMSTVMEKLRAKTQYQLAICDLGFSGLVNPKIVNRLLATTRFDSAEHLADTIKRYVKVYNQHISQKALGHIPPPSGDEKPVPKTAPAVQKVCL